MGGTQFLDESATCPWRRRPAYCACIQQGEYTTVGGRTPIKTDVRIIAATNKDLRTLIQQGLFREDLFFPPGTWCRCACRRCASARRMCPISCGTSSFKPSARACRQADRFRRARPAEALSLARKRARAGKPGPTSGRALSPGHHLARHHRGRTLRARAQFPLGGCTRRRHARRFGGAASQRVFRPVRRGSSPARPVSPHPARRGVSAAFGGPGGNPWQTKSRRPNCWG